MKRLQKIIILSLISTSALAWLLSANQADSMMIAMTTYNPLAISVFTASWTAGMVAMMFPAITPMVLLYNTFVTNKANRGGQSSITVQEDSRQKSSFSIRSLRVLVFIGSYLLVWALTGIALLVGWSFVMNNTAMSTGNTQYVPYVYGALLIIAGAYQFTPLKKKCIGYCESPVSFFLRRWRDGTSGAIKMGLYHGMYCLGCCWAYFLLMVALGWMNLLWMGLFAGIIFGEKIWSKGVWVARAAGVGLTIAGVLAMSGMLPSLVSPASSMMDGGDDQNVATPVNVESASENKIAQGDNNGQSMVQPSDSGKDQANPDMKMN